jgi:glyoxylase I family protein
MQLLQKLHHIAIICTNYEVSKKFFTEILGLKIENETYRKERDSYKLDLSLNGEYIVELFSFPETPKRLSRPEAAGLRHLAFEVSDIAKIIDYLKTKQVFCEPIRVDELTQKKFTFFSDPDNLPIELYEK